MYYNDNGRKGRGPSIVVYAWVCLLLIKSPFLFADTVTIEQQRRLYLTAEQALKNDNLTEFNRLAAQLKQYPLYPHLLYLKYQAHPGQIPQIAEFLKIYTQTRYAWPVRQRMLLYLAEKKHWQAYLEHYRATNDVTLQCHYFWALHQTGKTGQAWQGARKLWLAGRSRPAACDSLFSAWRKAGGLTDDLVWQRFQMALDNNQIRLAVYLQKMLPKARKSLASLWLEGHRHPEKILCDPDGIYQGSLLVHSIRRLARKDVDAALELWQQWAPKADLKPEAQASITRSLGLKLAWRHDARAWHWLARIPPAYQSHTIRAWRVRTALREKNWYRVKQAIHELTPREKQRGIWQYWLARAEEATGHQDSARGIYQGLAMEANFYGFMAADRLQRDYSILHRAIKPSAEKLAQLAASRSIKAIQEFLALDRYREARRQWWYLLSHLDSEELLAAAELARRQGWRQMAIFALANAKHWDDLEVRFPLHYLEPVTKHARYQQLAPAFVYGVIRRESAFDDRAYSSVGARGLMQLMPATARKVARSLNQRLDSLSVLEDPDTNIRLGTAYLRALLARFHGHFVLATAAYNAGPRRVERWLPGKQSLPADIWIETIPFRETRRYVRAVLAYAMIYQKRLHDFSKRISAYLEPVPVRRAPEQGEKKVVACSLVPVKMVRK